VPVAEDQQPVEALGADGEDETLGVSVRLRRADWCVDHFDAFTAEDLVERRRELAVAVVDQEADPLEHTREAEVARLLGHPVAGRVGRAARQVDATAAELDEEQHIEATKRDRLDGEEVAGEHAGALLAEEVPPARPRTPRRRLKTGREQHASNRARRGAQAELQRFARDSGVAPARILAREAQHQLSHLKVDGRAAWTSPRLCPLPTHEFPMPPQKCLWRHDQPVSAPLRKQSGERRQQGTIGRPQRGAPLLPSEHDELMSQHEQLEVFGELAAPVPDEQPQQSREGEIGEGKEHPPMLPESTTGQ
jgi:hypothetical protein